MQPLFLDWQKVKSSIRLLKLHSHCCLLFSLTPVFAARRVDGKEVISMPQRRLSFDCKTSKAVFTQQSDVISHTSSHDDMEKVPLQLARQELKIDPLIQSDLCIL